MSRLPPEYLAGVLRLHADEFPTSTPELFDHIAALEAELEQCKDVARRRGAAMGRMADAIRRIATAEAAIGTAARLSDEEGYDDEAGNLKPECDWAAKVDELRQAIADAVLLLSPDTKEPGNE